jgi:hypothetical protein
MAHPNDIVLDLSELRKDDFAITKLSGHPGTRWTGKIGRRSKPLGVKYEGDHFATPQDAKLAGGKGTKGTFDRSPQR